MSPPRGRRVLTVAVVVAVVVGGAVLASLTRTSDERAGAPISTTTPSTTEASTAAPATAAASTTTTTVASVCATLPVLTSARVEGDDAKLVLITSTGDIVQLDVATGALTCIRRAPSLGEWFLLHEMSGWRVQGGTAMTMSGYVSGGWYVPDDPNLEVSTWPGAVLIASAEPDRIWGWWPGEDRLSLIDLATGGIEPKATLLSTDAVEGPDGRGGVIIERASVQFVVAPEGRLTRLWDGGRVLFATATTLIGIRCSDDGGCETVAVARESGAVRRIGPATEVVMQINSWGTTFAPSGDLALVHAVDGSGPSIVDLRTGSRAPLSAYLTTYPQMIPPVVWTDGSDRVYAISGGGLGTWVVGTPPGQSEAVGVGDLPPLSYVMSNFPAK